MTMVQQVNYSECVNEEQLWSFLHVERCEENPVCKMSLYDAVAKCMESRCQIPTQPFFSSGLSSNHEANTPLMVLRGLREMVPNSAP